MPDTHDLHDIAHIARRSLGLDPAAAPFSCETDADGICWHARKGLSWQGRALSCALGAFDGVHAGHRRLISEAVADAHAAGRLAAVVTFDPDPADVLAGPVASSHLLASDDRLRLLEGTGADLVIVIPFDRRFMELPAADFVRDVLAGRLHAESVFVGTNFRFGYRGEGDVETLRAEGALLGIATHVIDLVSSEGSSVSATRIRGLIHDGKVEAASRLLGRCHFVRGRVQHGRGEGTSFGFPTANVKSDLEACMPDQGVYACIFVYGGKAWPAAANVGAPPTFAGPEAAFLEANLIGFSGDLYDDDVAVVFVRWLRDSRPFDSTEELERVVLSNIAWVRDNLGEKGRDLRA